MDQTESDDDQPASRLRTAAGTAATAEAQAALAAINAAIEAARVRLTVLQAEIAAAEDGARSTGAVQPSAEAEAALAARLVELNDAAVLQEVGIYEYHHPLETAAAYRDELTALQNQMKAAVKDGHAILASELFAFNNSLAKGRKMTATSAN